MSERAGFWCSRCKKFVRAGRRSVLEFFGHSMDKPKGYLLCPSCSCIFETWMEDHDDPAASPKEAPIWERGKFPGTHTVIPVTGNVSVLIDNQTGEVTLKKEQP